MEMVGAVVNQLARGGCAILQENYGLGKEGTGHPLVHSCHLWGQWCFLHDWYLQKVVPGKMMLEK